MPATESQKRASAKWRANNREKSKENVKRWREENPEKATAISRASGLKWYYKNREAQLEKNREKRRLAAEARMREYEERTGNLAPEPEPTTDSEAESEPEVPVAEPVPTPAPAPSPFVHRLFR